MSEQSAITDSLDNTMNDTFSQQEQLLKSIKTVVECNQQKMDVSQQGNESLYDEVQSLLKRANTLSKGVLANLTTLDESLTTLASQSGQLLEQLESRQQ